MFCSTCLSVDRQLFSICNFRDIFNMICGNVLFKSTPILCWECVAVLKKIKQFQDKVSIAHDLLTYQHEHEQKLFQTTLSNLQVSHIRNELYIQDSNDIVDDKEFTQNIKEESKTKEISNETKLDIKQEFGQSDNESIRDSDVLLDLEVKKDIEECNKHTRVKRRKLYKVICHKPLKTDFENFTVKLPIEVSEMKLWLEKERDSEEYKKWTFKCEKCVLGWEKEVHLLDHIKRCHDRKAPYECDVCSKRFMERKRLSLHMPCHRYLYQCSTCLYRGTAFAIRQHLVTHRRLIQCTECNGTWTNIRLFYKHYRESHGKFICDYCKKVCKSKGVLAKHISLNHILFKCEICNASYKKRATYLQHRNIKHSVSTGDDAYCVQCDKKFFNMYVYKSHLKYSSAHAHERKADKPKQKAVCPDCGRVYTRKTYMMNHYRHVHMKTSNYHCVQCNKYFLNSTKYIDHMKYSHEGATKAKDKLCNICGRGFAAKRTLVNHIRTHLGERPFECEYCGAKFTQKYAMLSHVSHIHLKNKRKQCWQGMR